MAQLQWEAEALTSNTKIEDEEALKAEMKPTVQLDIHTCHTSVSARERAWCYIIHLLERCTV